jgi:hypothetical protein
MAGITGLLKDGPDVGGLFNGEDSSMDDERAQELLAAYHLIGMISRIPPGVIK